MAITVFDPLLVQEIDEVLQGALWGVPMSKWSMISGYYELRYSKPLDYMSFGVTDIKDLVEKLHEQNKLLLFKKPESKEMHVKCVNFKESKQLRFFKSFVAGLLDKYGGEIAFETFQFFYNGIFREGWNARNFYNSEFRQLCYVLKDIVMVEVNSSGDRVMKAVKKKDSSRQAAVIREIEEILERCPLGIAMFDLSCIEGYYRLKHGKSLDYDSFGVANIRDLIIKLGDKKKVTFKRTEREVTYVMSVPLTERQNKGRLKFMVEKLLYLCGGEIAFRSFQYCYENRFTMGWNPLYYGMTDLDQLCDALKDIVMVRVNSSGDKVMKAVNKTLLRTGGLKTI